MASYRLKRKTFAFLGIGNMSRNLNIAGRAASMGKIGAAAKAGGKALGTGALYAGTAAGAIYGTKKVADTVTGDIGTDY